MFPPGSKSLSEKPQRSERESAVWALAALALITLPLRSSRADEPAPAATPNSPAAQATPGPIDTGGLDEPQLPDIEARSFAVKVARRSTSGKTYLFDDVSDSKTHPGKILLLRRESEPIMAFRVVKIYDEQKQFAAKRVRRYGAYHILDGGESYVALEKVGDVAIPPPTAQDKADLKELEAKPDVGPAPPPTAPGPEVHPFDSDLDAGTSPPPSGAVDSENMKDAAHDRDDDEDEQTRFGMTVEEVTPLDPNNQWLSACFGYFNNGGNYFAGAGARYGLSLGKMIFLRKAHLQDSLAVEGGVFFYKILGYTAPGATADPSSAYSVLPFEATARYNVLFGENFGIFFYGGMMQNIVTNVSGGDATTQASLQTILPAVGTGLLFRVGPSWETRVDLGYEMISLGLMLRF